VYNVRDIVKEDISTLWQTLPDLLTIRFEDGTELITNKRQTFYSRYAWEIFNHYPNTPITQRHHVASVLKGSNLSSDTHIKLFEVILTDVVDTYKLTEPESKEHILELIYLLTNRIHNEISKYAEEYVTSIDILDFLEVIDHPVIKQANDTCEENHRSIFANYATIMETMMKDPSLINNGLVRAVKSKMVNANQVFQCVAIRGFPTEVTGAIMSKPIMSNYTKGMNTVYDYITESRSAAKALYFSEAPLQDAEYFARRLQLLTMVVQRVSYTDCGSTKYVRWLVVGPTKDDVGNTVYAGDLKFMVGKNYMDEDGKMKQIRGDETHLYGKTINMRSVLTCKHHNSHEVCAVCFGGLSSNVSRFSNLGHICAATMTQQTSQSVLSTKHLDASSFSAAIVLDDHASKFFTTNRQKNAYLVKKEMKDKQACIVIDRDSVVGLTDIIDVENMEDINPMRISSVDYVDVTFKQRNEDITINISVSQGSRKASLTMEFLEYLKTHRWQNDGRGNFIFCLKNWDYSKPIMKLPEMEYSFSDHSRQVAKVIESSMKNMEDRNKPHSPVATLQELFNLVNNKLNVNIACLEVIIYAMMIPGDGKFALARNVDNAILGTRDKVMYNRSMGTALGYQTQHKQLVNPRNFFKLDRPDSIFDVFIKPGEYVQHLKSKQK
jgi:hypothetical protein